MPLFDFQLRPLDKVAPWGRPERPRLHWFGLTDGWYSIDVGRCRLFEYSEAIVKRWAEEYPKTAGELPWTAYSVVRLYEDVLAMLPTTLVEVPDELHQLVAGIEAQREWSARVEKILEGEDDADPERWGQHDNIHEWFGIRQLDTGYLIHGPKIWIWRNRDRIFILWDNEGRVTEGEAWWTAGSGLFSLAVEDYLSEVERFHASLMKAMAERVGEVVEKDLFPQVDMDRQALVEEQTWREGSLSRALLSDPQMTDWTAAIRANRTAGD